MYTMTMSYFDPNRHRLLRRRRACSKKYLKNQAHTWRTPGTLHPFKHTNFFLRHARLTTSTYTKCLISIHLGACSPHRGGDGLLAGAASAPRHIVPSSAHRAPRSPGNVNSLCQYLNVTRLGRQRKPSRWLGRQEVGIAV